MAGVGIIRWDGANTNFNQNSANSIATNLTDAVNLRRRQWLCRC